MNYKLSEDIIHDSKAMWDLACSFKIHYDFIKDQIEKSKIDNSILYE